ncbi:unnamed protein product [Calypogeia fissa]
MRGLSTSRSSRMYHTILQLELLICAALSLQLNVVSTDAAATDYGYGRRMRDPAAELEGSLARYRHLIANHEEFASMRNLLQEDKKKASEQHEADEQNLISSQS